MFTASRGEPVIAIQGNPVFYFIMKGSEQVGIMRSKLVWLLLIICLVAFFGIVGCGKEVEKAKEVEKVEKEVLPEKEIMLEEPGEPVEKKVLPQAEPLEEPEETETGVIEFMQGRVNGIDPDLREIMVGSIWFNAGSLDLTKFHIGDLVEVTYTKKKHGKYRKVIESIEILEKRVK